MCVCIYVYIYIYIYTYIYIHTSLHFSARWGQRRAAEGRERGVGERAQPEPDQVPHKASRFGKRHNSVGSPGTVMRPGCPRLGVVKVKGHMQLSNHRRKTSICSHDTQVPMKGARNAPKGCIGKHLAHHTVVSLGRGSAVCPVSTLARENDMPVSERGAAPPAAG